jgi:hypothetical protein
MPTPRRRIPHESAALVITDVDDVFILDTHLHPMSDGDYLMRVLRAVKWAWQSPQGTEHLRTLINHYEETQYIPPERIDVYRVGPLIIRTPVRQNASDTLFDESTSEAD